MVRPLLQSPDPLLHPALRKRGREKGSGANSAEHPKGRSGDWFLTPFPALSKLGVTNIQFQQFDPAAVVLMRAGPDGQPGVARVDDDRNGTIDDRSELGATYSDDVCSVETVDEQDDAVLLLQYGAFVPTSTDQLHNETPQPIRAVVYGESAVGERWSFLVEL